MSRSRRRARLAGNGGSHTPEEWSALCRFYGNRCLACGSAGKMTKDHVIPLCRGGLNDIRNLQPLCKDCNMRKSDQVIDYRQIIISGSKLKKFYSLTRMDESLAG